MDDINVQLVDFKITTSYELVRRNEDDSVTILLNSRQASNQLRKAYTDAIKHLRRGHCDSHGGNVQEMESEVHEEEKE